MKKVYYLEGLRGIAAFIVVISHFVQVFYPALFEKNGSLSHNNFELHLSDYPINILYNGNFAVCIFFILSGYVLSLKYFKEKKASVLYELAFKRYFRLGIPVVFSLLIAYIFMNFNLFFYADIKEVTRATMENPFVLEHDFIGMIKLAFIGVFLGNNAYNPVLWTMYYELIGSFMIFLTLPLMVKLKSRIVKMILLIIISLLLAKYFSLYFIAFFLGLILCNMQYNNNLLFGFKSKWFNVITFILGIFFGSYPYIETSGTMYDFLYLDFLGINNALFYRIVGSFLLMLSVLKTKWLQDFFNKKIIVYLGKISFALYLTHFLLIGSLSAFLFDKFHSVGINYNVSVLFSFITSIVIMILVAHIVSKYVDEFAIRFSKLLYQKVFSLKKKENKGTILKGEKRKLEV